MKTWQHARRGEPTNIAFLLTPKSEVVWVRATGTLGQAIERMRPNGFAAVPVLDDEGGYVGTLTEGDMLWHLLDAPTGGGSADITLRGVHRRTTNDAVHIDADIKTLILRAAVQNFVPVLDDRNVFIGIVRRKTIIEHYLASPRNQQAGAADSGPSDYLAAGGTTGQH